MRIGGLVAVVDKVAANAVHHPHRHRQRLVNAGDVGAEQEGAHKPQRRMLGAALARGDDVVVEQAFIDGRIAPGFFQKEADHRRSCQQPEHAVAPARVGQAPTQPFDAPVGAWRRVERRAAIEPRGADQCHAAVERWHLVRGTRGVFTRQRDCHDVDRHTVMGSPYGVGHRVHRIGHQPRQVRAIGAFGKSEARQVECIHRPQLTVVLVDRANLACRTRRIDAVQQQQRRRICLPCAALGCREVVRQPPGNAVDLDALARKRWRQKRGL